MIIDEDVKAFIEESRGLLDRVEPELIALEKRLERLLPVDRKTVDLVFRMFHTIKGTAGFYQFDRLVEITHRAETRLEVFRDGGGSMHTSDTQLFCATCDFIETLFQEIEKTGTDAGIDASVQKMCASLGGSGNLMPDEPPMPIEDSLSSEIAESKRVRKKNAYLLCTEGKGLFERLQALVRQMNTFHGPKVKMDVDLVSACMETMRILQESAAFFEFTDIASVFEGLTELLQSGEKKEWIFSRSEIEVFVYGCGLVEDLMGKVEADEEVLPYEEQVETILTAVANPDIFVFDDTAQASGQNVATDFESHTPVFSSRMDIDVPQIFFDEAQEYMSDSEDFFFKMISGNLTQEMWEKWVQVLEKFGNHCLSMGYGDMGMLSHKTGKMIQAALNKNSALDQWNTRAVHFVLKVMKDTLKKMGETGNGRILNIAVLSHMLENISFLDSVEEKFSEMWLPEMYQSSHHLRVMPSTDSKAILQERRFSTPGCSPKDPVPFVDETFSEDDPGLSRMLERRDVRVSLDKLDDLIDLVGELVIAENMMARSPEKGIWQEKEMFEKAFAHLSKIVQELQELVFSVRMVPVAGVFRKMIRLVHDLSLKSNKKVNLRIVGEDIEIDKTVSDYIADPLVHLIRNAIDHGIPAPNDQKSGLFDGCITLEARYEGSEIWILVKDNGVGLDLETIREKGIERGYISGNDENVDEQTIMNLIFEPGFSTKKGVDSVSGRGVGMDVVKENIEKIKGRVRVLSPPGKGTTFVLQIPLTLGIIEGMLVRVGEVHYTIPLLSIRESIQLRKEDVVISADSQEMAQIRGEEIPVIRLHKLYRIDKSCHALDEGLIVVVQEQCEIAAFFVDEIIGEHHAVIKPLSGYMKAIRGVSGCTILGDGQVSLVIDAGDVIHMGDSKKFPVQEILS